MENIHPSPPYKEEPKPAKSAVRQSELSSQIDPKSVLESILNTDVTLPLKTILGTSKEVAYNLQEHLKVKNASTAVPPNATKAAHYVNNGPHSTKLLDYEVKVH